MHLLYGLSVLNHIFIAKLFIKLLDYFEINVFDKAFQKKIEIQMKKALKSIAVKTN